MLIELEGELRTFSKFPAAKSKDELSRGMAFILSRIPAFHAGTVEG
jgi:hypothetical protein